MKYVWFRIKGRKVANQRIGIVGGYGRVGLEAAQYLIKTTDYDIVIGGRSIRKADETATNLGARVSARMMDINDQSALDAFCRRCDIVINCAGPSAVVRDRVAQAAMRESVHYIDPGGYNPLYCALGKKETELISKGLTFLLAIGLMPGLSEVFPIHVAKSHFDQVNTIEYFYIGRDRWTFNSAYDIAWGIGNIGHGAASVFYKNGQRKNANLWTSGKIVNLPPPIGKHKLFLVFREELREFVESSNIRSVRVYGNNWGPWVCLTTMLISLLRMYRSEEQLRRSAHLIVKASKRDMKNKEPGFMLHLILKGEKNGCEKKVVSTLFLKDTYRATGVCAAVAAYLVGENIITQRGRFWLPQVGDSTHFMSLLEQEGYVPSYSP